MSDSRDSIKEKLKILGENYLVQLPERLEEIDCCYNALRRGLADKEVTRNLHRLAHSIKGSSASFGFKDVSNAALSLSRLLEPFLEGEAQPATEHLAEAGDIIRKLRTAVGILHPKTGKEVIGSTSADSTSEPTAKPDDKQMIYIVDGNPSLLDELSSAIRQFGYEVTGFTLGSQLEHAIIKERPAAVILDAQMPEEGLSGHLSLIDLRKKLGNEVPAIFISDRSDVEARLEAVRAGSDAYFAKPVNINDLVEKLDSLTANKVSEPYKILVVDDELELAHYHSLLLQEAGMVTEIVDTPLKVFDRLPDYRPDLILMDMYMPECNGMELAKTIRQTKTYFSIPIVFLSGETNIDKQLSAMIMGGDEFLTKPIRPEHLISSVSIRAERMRVIRAFMERDSLTGLFNHTMTKVQLDIAMRRSRRLNSEMSFAMIDLDRFKSVNDTYGHPMGDRVIAGLARLLQQRLRKTDVIGRYGGEEFAVVLNESNAYYTKQVLDRIRASFSQINFRHMDQEFSVTFSAGVASFPKFGDAESISDAADKALYEAKRIGRNAVVIAPD